MRIWVLAMLVAGRSCSETTAPTPPTTAVAPFGAFVALHLEVGNAPQHQGLPFFNDGSTHPGPWQAYFWPWVKEAVAYADLVQARLTILANVQWFEFILANAGRLETLQSWAANGHEIGLHHHGYDHPDWDGFSDRTSPAVRNDPRYRGTVAQLLSIIAAVPGMIASTATDRAYDLETINSVFLYDAAGKGDTVEPARRPPYRAPFSNLDLIQVGMAFHGSDNDEAHLEELKALFPGAQPTDLIGFVTHEWDIVAAGPIPMSFFGEWLDFLASRGVGARTIRDLIQSYPFPIETVAAEQLIGKW